MSQKHTCHIRICILGYVFHSPASLILLRKQVYLPKLRACWKRERKSCCLTDRQAILEALQKLELKDIFGDSPLPPSTLQSNLKWKTISPGISRSWHLTLLWLFFIVTAQKSYEGGGEAHCMYNKSKKQANCAPHYTFAKRYVTFV